MKRFQYLMIIPLFCLLAASCAPAVKPQVLPSEPAQETEGAVESVKIQQSEKMRNENPQVPDSDLEQLEEGNRAFALNLYQQLRSQEGNLFYSPYSISLALAMTFAGARGETEAQMADVLHFDLPQEDLHPAFNALSQILESRAQPVGEDQEGGLELSIANSLWGQAGYSFQTEFLDRLAENYAAGMREVDFAQSEQARKLINDWVAEETRDKIKNLIPQGVLDELTRLVLANAIYFKAAWQHPFDEGMTAQQEFTLMEGGMIQVDMMRQSEMLDYNMGDGYQAVRLPYSGDSADMLVLLPDQGRFAEFEEALNAETVIEILSGLESRQINLVIPKFKVESTFELSDALPAMGMQDAFDASKADFSSISGKPELYISNVVHKAFVDVNEAGTEAAAATAVIMKLGSVPAEPLTLQIDRPFIFMILDRATGTVLFVGRVLDPR
jgi:serpin B